MTDEGASKVTQWLRQWRAGDGGALERMMPLVYDELRRIADRHLRGERKGHTLQATALVNEAYLRLVDADVTWNDRVHFYAVAANTIRRILVDHARSRARAKRGGGQAPLQLDEALAIGSEPAEDLIELDDALRRLAEFDERKSKVIELRFFGGLTYEETAAALGISDATVHRELRMAKAWLYQQLSAGENDGS